MSNTHRHHEGDPIYRRTLLVAALGLTATVVAEVGTIKAAEWFISSRTKSAAVTRSNELTALVGASSGDIAGDIAKWPEGARKAAAQNTFLMSIKFTDPNGGEKDFSGTAWQAHLPDGDGGWWLLTAAHCLTGGQQGLSPNSITNITLYNAQANARLVLDKLSDRGIKIYTASSPLHPDARSDIAGIHIPPFAAPPLGMVTGNPSAGVEIAEGFHPQSGGLLYLAGFLEEVASLKKPPLYGATALFESAQADGTLAARALIDIGASGGLVLNGQGEAVGLINSIASRDAGECFVTPLSLEAIRHITSQLANQA